MDYAVFGQVNFFAGEEICPFSRNRKVNIALVACACGDGGNQDVLAEHILIVYSVGSPVIGEVHYQRTNGGLSCGVVSVKRLLKHGYQAIAQFDKLAYFILAVEDNPRDTVIVPSVNQALGGEDNALHTADTFLLCVCLTELGSPEKTREARVYNAADKVLVVVQIAVENKGVGSGEGA